MSLILVDGMKDRPGTGGPKFPNGLHLPAGIGITGDGHINMAGVCTFSGNVTIGGTLTYEDVTNIDSVGVVTARSGVNVSGGEFKVGTAITVGSAGVSTFFGAVNLNRKTTVNATLEATEGLNVTAGVGTFGGNVSIADKIIHTGDTNTALRFPAADTITAETGGSERLRIDSAGKIGINNNAPLYAMHLKNAFGSSPSWIHMEVTGSNTVGGGGGIAFDSSATNSASNNSLFLATIKGIRNSDDDGSNDLVFSTSTNGVAGDDGNTSTPKEKLRITATGLVGIGTNVPAALLHVSKLNGAAEIMVTSSTQPRLMLKTTGTTAEGRVDFGDSGDSSRGAIGYNHNDDALKFYTSGVANERARIDSSGRVLVGTTTEGFATADNFTISDTSTDCGMTIRSGTSSQSIIAFSDATSGAAEYAGYLSYYHNTDELHIAAVSKPIVKIHDEYFNIYANEGTTRMNFGFTDTNGGELSIYDDTGAQKTRICGSTNTDTFFNNGGGVRVGSTGPVSSEMFTAQKSNAQVAYFDASGTGDVTTIQCRNRRATGTTYGMQMEFRVSDGSAIGYISTHGSTCLFGNNSDYRLKENVVNLTGGITRIKNLKPYRFNFKATPTETVDGFYAHEVSTVVGNAVVGDKDAVNDDGSIKPQAMDNAKLVPLLTAALQESITKIETLETKVAALESS